MSLKLKRVISAVAFFLLIACVVCWAQDLVTPKYDWPEHNRRSLKSLGSVYNEPKNSLDVVFLGTSQTFCGISPMDIYDATHVRSYNLGTIGQRIPVAYYLLKSILRRQSPKLVFLDASGFFYTEDELTNTGKWLEMIDTLPWKCLGDKIEMVNALAELQGKSDDLEYKLGLVIPLLRYHADYMVGRNNYFKYHMNQVYQRKGFVAAYNVRPVSDAGIAMARAMLDADDPSSNDDDALPVLSAALEANVPFLQMILDLCRENDIRLVFFKVPVSCDTTARGYWSANKHGMVQALAEQMDVPFLDLNYVDLGLDWHKDTHDSGVHLNYRGAMKVTRYLADWMTEHYPITPGNDAKLDEQWDYQSKLFAREMELYDLELETDLAQYLDRAGKGDYTLFMAVSDAMGPYWSDEAQQLLSQATGAQYDLRDPESAAWVCASRDGEVIVEKRDPKTCAVEAKLEDGLLYRLESKTARETGKEAVLIWGTSFTGEEPGLHIVVYDNELGCVVDSVCFDGNTPAMEGRHRSGYQEIMREYLIKYVYGKMKKM